MEERTVKCLNPWDCQSKRIYDVNGTYRTLDAGNVVGGQAHGICYAIDQQGGKGNCGYAEDVMMTLCSDSHGTPHALCYAIEGNTVDRASSKNGRGWCENVSPTLNTQDRHAVIYALEGNGARPSHAGNGYSDTGQMYTLNTIEQHSVCYLLDAISSNSFKSSNPHSGIHETTVAKCLDTRCLDPNCNQGGMMICYSVDCRNLEVNREKSGTLQAKGNGGFSYNYLNPVLMENMNERQV